MSKSRDAFRTISEVSDALDTPAHVLRFWESKFAQVKPVKRAGGRRYYRPSDVDLLAGIKKLLHEDGMTIKGAQKLLRERGVKAVQAMGAETLCATADTPVDTPKAAPTSPPPETAPEPAPEAKAEETAPDGTVEITNIVTLPPKTAPAPKTTPDADGPALSLNLGPTDTDAPATPEIEEPAEAAPAPWQNLPADPSDGDSKLPARLFQHLQKAPADGLAARSAEIAPLLDRMKALRGRISLR